MCKSIDRKEIELLKRVATGDRIAMEMLYHEHYSFAFLEAYYRSQKNRSLAEDIVQTCFLHLFEALTNEKYKPNETISFRNKLKNCIRSKLRTKVFRPIAPISLSRTGEDTSEVEILDPRPSGERPSEVPELVEDLNACINSLPLHLVMLIRMKYIDGMTIPEIAEIWRDDKGQQKTPDSIKNTYLPKARKVILRCLQRKGHKNIFE